RSHRAGARAIDRDSKWIPNQTLFARGRLAPQSVRALRAGEVPLTGAGIRLTTPETDLPRDVTPEEADIFRKIEPYTMTSVERVISLIRAVKYVVDNRLEGAFVECGVWRGGSMMAVSLAMMNMGETGRSIFL